MGKCANERLKLLDGFFLFAASARAFGQIFLQVSDDSLQAADDKAATVRERRETSVIWNTAGARLEPCEKSKLGM